MRASSFIGALFILALSFGFVLPQGTTYKSGQVLTTGTTLPNVCDNGAVYIKTTAPIGVYICTAANVWTSVSNSGLFGGTPTVSACGTTPSVIGTDQAGIITIGSGTVTSCTLTFSAAFATAPSCVAVGSSATINAGVTTTTTTLAVALGATLGGGKIHYHCYGR